VEGHSHSVTGGGVGPYELSREFEDVAAVLPRSTLAVLDGQGHEAIESAPGLLADRLAGFFR
jgi:hypothetical protein